MHLVYCYLVHLISLNGDGNYQEDTDTQGNVGSNLSKWMNVEELKKHYTIKQLSSLSLSPSPNQKSLSKDLDLG